jgi:hypothetical protein
MSRVFRLVAVFACACVATLGASLAYARTEHVLSARHAILRSPADAITKPLGQVQGCQVLLDTGNGDCSFVQTAHGQIGFTVEPYPYPDKVLVSRPWVVRVYRVPKGDTGTVDLALSTRPDGTDPGPLYANVTAKVADVTGDGKDELLIGYRSEGTGQILDVDIVGTKPDGAPTVLAHETLYKGSVDLSGSSLVQYVPVYAKGEANCCPRWIERDVVRFHDGVFRIEQVKRTLTKHTRIPPGDLG